MMELPEAFVLAGQMNDTVQGKGVVAVIAAQTPHKFAWYHGDPLGYHGLLAGHAIDAAKAYGGMVEIKTGPAILLIGDGVGLRYHGPHESRPSKHQLLIEFEDSSALSATVQMYGGMWCFKEGGFDNPYYQVAKGKPSPLADEFNEAYFDRLISAPDVQKLSAKAFLATQQRIPGLGNGVLQDILWKCQIHPKRKVNSLSDKHKERMLSTVKTVLKEMTELGGRDTEKDLFGNQGRYQTVMSKNNAHQKCPVCSGLITKENYLGGSVYYCPQCQEN
ncbi:zinc finger domain-containing protein [Candidatus Formimonas warabiya]|uniref:Endonuclease VIII n=1 Tax=Formimonas warabiya TaxID=1761012 RepID=A0A3G1KTF0_FORW1|nr:zinc finger domain-containing protein [Candidatus Formimonas warabiya]ATW25752.1 endonuclease VIII [Candidatus Formimonas warabiya]